MKILIGYDDSENADFAIEDLRYAGFPKSVDAVVLTAADVFIAPPITDPEDVFPPVVPHSVQLAHEHAQRKLKDAQLTSKYVAERLRKDFPDGNVDAVGVANSPAWAIIDKASELGADLVIVGAVGHSVFGGRLILGSVSQRVLFESDTSVRIARPPQKKKDDEPLKIIVGVDNSSFSEAAVEEISKRHWPAGTQVRVVAVVDTVVPVLPNPNKPAEMKWVELSDETWNQVRQTFQPSADKLIARGLDAAVMIIRGNPTDAIVEEAESWGADCIFVGSKGLRGIERLLLGSVAAAVSARAHCSVEVVRRRKTS